jgi:hypothetical protein
VTGSKKSKKGQRNYVCEYQKGVCQQRLDQSSYHVGSSNVAKTGQWRLIRIKAKGLLSRQSQRVQGGGGNSNGRMKRSQPGATVSGIDEYIPEKF